MRPRKADEEEEKTAVKSKRDGKNLEGKTKTKAVKNVKKIKKNMKMEIKLGRH